MVTSERTVFNGCGSGVLERKVNLNAQSVGFAVLPGRRAAPAEKTNAAKGTL